MELLESVPCDCRFKGFRDHTTTTQEVACVAHSNKTVSPVSFQIAAVGCFGISMFCLTFKRYSRPGRAVKCITLAVMLFANLQSSRHFGIQSMCVRFKSKQ